MSGFKKKKNKERNSKAQRFELFPSTPSSQVNHLRNRGRKGKGKFSRNLSGSGKKRWNCLELQTEKKSFMPVDKVNQSLITQEGDHSLTIKGSNTVCNVLRALLIKGL